MGSLLHWLPRLLSLAFAGFVALFALDIGGERGGFELVAALVANLAPALLVLVVAFAGWRNPIAGAIGFLALAAGYVVLVGPDRHWSWYASMSGPSVALALLFLADWARTKSLRRPPGNSALRE